MNRYLVQGSYIDPGPLLDDEVGQVMQRTRTLPSQEMLAQWEGEGRIVAGGVVTGVRTVVFLADAESNDALHELVAALPFWGLLEWTVVPLQTFAARASQTRRLLEGPTQGIGPALNEARMKRDSQ